MKTPTHRHSPALWTILSGALLLTGVSLLRMQSSESVPDITSSHLPVTGEPGGQVLRAAPRSRPVAEPMPVAITNPQQRPATTLDQLPKDEQESIQSALRIARHSASPVEGEVAKRAENQGVHYFSANPGQDLTARFMENGGVRFQSGRPGKSWQERFD